MLPKGNQIPYFECEKMIPFLPNKVRVYEISLVFLKSNDGKIVPKILKRLAGKSVFSNYVTKT